MPVASWLDDRIQHIDPNGWRLGVTSVHCRQCQDVGAGVKIPI